MAGMLPGVESARRRRCDPSSVVASGFGSARIRLSHDTHLAPTSFLPRISSDEDDKLGGAAKEDKERLDGRLRGHLKQEIRRENSKETLSSVKRSSPKVTEDLQMENFRSKKTTIGWGKRWLRWKSSEEDECAICLVQFKASVKIAHLRCAHRFHSDCLLPWLETNAHCPCCRATVFGSN